MWSAREKVECLERVEVIIGSEKDKVTGLCGRIAGKVYDGNWMNVNEAVDEVGMTAGAWRIKDDGGVGSDEIESSFRFGEMSGNIGVGWRSERGGRF